MLYSIDEINIGDEVTFVSTALQTNHDDYWIVTGKDEKLKKVYIKTSPRVLTPEYWTLEIDEIVGHIPLGGFRKQ